MDEKIEMKRSRDDIELLRDCNVGAYVICSRAAGLFHVCKNYIWKQECRPSISCLTLDLKPLGLVRV